jgi:hypothetical protein
MPRPANIMNEGQQRRQQRYRARLRAAGQPEASAVDIAVAEAVAMYVGEAALDPSLDAIALKRILRDALDRLAHAGCDRQLARLKIIRRTGRFGHSVPPGLDGDSSE